MLSQGGLRVVATDGDPAVRAFYQGAFGRMGHEARVCTRAEVLAHCATRRPDLLVVDHCAGLSSAAIVCRKAPVAVLAACRSAEEALALSTGDVPIAGLALKPWTEESLRVAVASALLCFGQAQALRQ